MTTSAAKANRNADIVNRLEAENERLLAALKLTHEWFEDGTWIPDLDGRKCSVGHIGPRTKAVQDAVREALEQGSGR